MYKRSHTWISTLTTYGVAYIPQQCENLWENRRKYTNSLFVMVRPARMASWHGNTLYGVMAWASYQIRKIAGCACAGNAGNVFSRRRFQRKPLVSDPGMHHGTCVTHVSWCMSGSLTRGDRENVPGIPGACAPTILRIWQEAHGNTLYGVMAWKHFVWRHGMETLCMASWHGNTLYGVMAWKHFVWRHGMETLCMASWHGNTLYGVMAWKHFVWRHGMETLCMASWHGNTLNRITGPLWGKSISHQWFPLTLRGDNVALWCFICYCPEECVRASSRLANDMCHDDNSWILNDMGAFFH